ncbi:MAG: glycosyltransferase [Alloprevotella sp.]|nr:glycosyltransferase [Alloprevotella sp.]
MNIAFFWAWPMYEHIGGVQRVTCLLTREFQRRGYKVFFAAFMRKNGNEAYLSQLKNDFQQDLKNYVFIAPQIIIELDEKLLNAKETVQAFVKKEQIDYVIQQEPSSWSAAILDALPSNVVKVLVKHNKPLEINGVERSIYKRHHPTGLFDSLKTKLYIMLPFIPRMRDLYVARKTYIGATQHADRLCLLSRHFIPRLNRLVPGIDSSKICAISNPSTFKPQSVEITQKNNKVIMVCRMEDSTKNVSDFLKAWSVVEAKHPDWCAELVGDGTDLNALKKLAYDLKLKQCRFLGYQCNVKEIFSSARINCVCSWFEGFPMVIVESLAFGCVTISYDTFEAVRDTIDDGINGMIVSSNTPDELAAKICYLIENPRVLNRMADKSIEKCKAFDVEKIVDQWIALYETIKIEKVNGK